MPRKRGQLRYSSNRPKGARVPKPTVPKPGLRPPTSIFEGLPKQSIPSHLGEFKRTTDFFKKATGGRF